MAKLEVKVDVEKVKEILTAAVNEAKVEVDNLIHEAVTRAKNQMILDVLNNLERVEEYYAFDESWILVENTPELHAALNAVGVPSSHIDEYSDSEDNTTCILTLAFSYGYANVINDNAHLELLPDDELQLMFEEINQHDQHHDNQKELDKLLGLDEKGEK